MPPEPALFQCVSCHNQTDPLPSADFPGFVDENLKHISDSFDQTFADARRSTNWRRTSEVWRNCLPSPRVPTPSPDDPDRCGEVCLDAKDGWKAIFRYGADGRLHYISEFVTPAGPDHRFLVMGRYGPRPRPADGMVPRRRCRVPSLGMIRGARLLLDIVRGSIDESKLPYARNTAKQLGATKPSALHLLCYVFTSGHN